MSWGMTLGLANQQTNAIPQRKFVDGEKFWMATHDVHIVRRVTRALERVEDIERLLVAEGY
jgi:hypothetical protein